MKLSTMVLLVCVCQNTLADTAHERGEFSIGTAVTYFSYAEELSPPSKSTETVLMTPIIADMKLFASRNSMHHLDFKYLTASSVTSKYVGSSLTTGAPVTSTDSLGFTNYEATANVAITEHWLLYIGYGYHVWNRFLSGNPGYREIYSWYYTPVGAQVLFGNRAQFSWGMDASLRPTSRGSIKVITSQTVSGGQDSQMDLGGRKGYRLAVPMRWIYGPMSLTATPWFEHSAIGQSNVALNSTLAPTPGTGIEEPNSHTDQYGVDLMMGFPF